MDDYTPVFYKQARQYHTHHCVYVCQSRGIIIHYTLLSMLCTEGAKLFGFPLFHPVKIGKESMTPPIRGGLDSMTASIRGGVETTTYPYRRGCRIYDPPSPLMRGGSRGGSQGALAPAPDGKGPIFWPKHFHTTSHVIITLINGPETGQGGARAADARPPPKSTNAPLACPTNSVIYNTAKLI